MIYSAVKNVGMRAHALDISFSSKMNILSSFGFLLTLYNVPWFDGINNIGYIYIYINSNFLRGGAYNLR